jgi:HK97 gp10 family phage protein
LISAQIVDPGKFLTFLANMHQGYRAKVEAAINASVLDGQTLARQLTPVKTGYLRTRNRTRLVTSSATMIIYELYNDADYAIYVCYGTYKMPARNFMTPAVAYTKLRMVERFAAIRPGN